MSRDQRVPEVFAKFAGIRKDFSTRSSDIDVFFKHLVKLVNTGPAGFGTDVEENTDIGLDEWCKGIEEPPMGVELLLVSPEAHE